MSCTRAWSLRIIEFPHSYLILIWLPNNEYEAIPVSLEKLDILWPLIWEAG